MTDNARSRLPPAWSLALAGFGIVVLSNFYMMVWLAQGPGFGPRSSIYLLIFAQWVLWGAIGLLGIVHPSGLRGAYWPLLTWVGIGGLGAVTFLAAFSIIYFTLPTMLTYGAAAVKVAGHRRWLTWLGLGLALATGVAVSLVSLALLPR